MILDFFGIIGIMVVGIYLFKRLFKYFNEKDF